MITGYLASIGLAPTNLTINVNVSLSHELKTDIQLSHKQKTNLTLTQQQKTNLSIVVTE